LPVAALDLAEQLAYQARVETVQRYCETLLLQALTAADAHDHDTNRVIDLGARPEDLRTVADDPDYLAEWTATVLDQLAPPQLPEGVSPTRASLPDPPVALEQPETMVERPAVEVILRHAGLRGNDPDAFLTALRSDGKLHPQVGPELIQALADLEAESRHAPVLDRLLCFALHKLAFEGQILVTEGTRNVAMEESIVDLLRLIQERVDRVLSGQDIRYFSSHDRNASSTG
jgi:hypothetical protein